MKSFCFKTNNNQILDYLLKRIKEIDFENLVYSNNQFKVYKNVIIHYKGKDEDKFQEFICDLVEEIVIKFYEEKIIKQLINYNYFYFDEYEKMVIVNNCLNLLDENNYKIIREETKEYILNNKTMVLNGFVYFRLKKYFEILDNIVDGGVNQYIIDKEYKEFISLLRMYVESRNSNYDLLHLIYKSKESILLDENKNIVSVSDNIYNAKYLSDISFSSNDFALNTLLSLLPEKIEIHLIDEEDEFINTLKLIFEGRIKVCKECDICKTYKILNNTKLTFEDLL